MLFTDFSMRNGASQVRVLVEFTYFRTHYNCNTCMKDSAEYGSNPFLFLWW